MRTILLALSIALAAPTFAKEPVPRPSEVDRITGQQPIEAAFSPDGQSERLVLSVIDGSQQSIRLAAYSFTSPAVVRALIAAHRRGVDVRVVVDEQGNKSKSSVAALNLLVGASIPARTVSKYAIHHDKYIISDGRTVQTGSFNYSQAAAKSNSENVIVIRDNPDLAARYMQHWESRWGQGVDYQLPY